MGVQGHTSVALLLVRREEHELPADGGGSNALGASQSSTTRPLTAQLKPGSTHARRKRLVSG